VLAEYHATRAHQSRHEEQEKQPPCGIESEKEREGNERTYHTANGCRMGGYLPTKIDKSTHYLQNECRNNHRTDEMRHVEQV